MCLVFFRFEALLFVLVRKKRDKPTVHAEVVRAVGSSWQLDSFID